MGTEGIEPPSGGLEPPSLPLAYAPLFKPMTDLFLTFPIYTEVFSTD